ncbi:putative nuclear pore complex, NUP2/50/61 protein [Medicago truncatula]|uniref:Putative nuclear pore complex, NUP2/50/61 protein n=1 Tax=Medicago truncatula TaxID=3880 RepID=A0A396K380_MEDTR|nr:putative nuclear pore complex, NUP2/50/61 protein [Medicago truncatula]
MLNAYFLTAIFVVLKFGDIEVLSVMEDAKNALQSSKKRAAERELTRDTPLDDEEDDTDLEAGTFKKASDEVLATKRIIKVSRRQQNNSDPSSNPVAGIRLAAPTVPTAQPGEEVANAMSWGASVRPEHQDSLFKQWGASVRPEHHDGPFKQGTVSWGDSVHPKHHANTINEWGRVYWDGSKQQSH